MANYIRKIVSGNKARFRDGKLNVELDLVYITDHVIIMGYPASGFEGFYRNRREDAKKFLEHRHGNNYWVFNFCPITENSYDADLFDGRVSRYPFPDHHAPPLAIMPLVAREMRAWLNGSPERVAVLHCKAGKGRSGTMACSYLLALDDEATPPRLERSYNAKQWAKIRADAMMDVMPEDSDSDTETAPPTTAKPLSVPTPVAETEEDPITSITSQERTESPATIPQPKEKQVLLSTQDTDLSRRPSKSYKDSLKGVLELHTSRRMKSPSGSDAKVKQGVSIPSQRRWLSYWALLLAHEGPPGFWDAPAPSRIANNITEAVGVQSTKMRVRMTEVTLRMKESSGVKMNLVRAANAVLERTNMGKAGAVAAKAKGQSHVWVSLARYDDEFVELLERWERYTRDDEEGHMGKRRKGSDHIQDEVLSEMFKDGKWDSKKMVRSFARMGAMEDGSVVKNETEKDGKVITYHLKPLSDTRWADLKEELQEVKKDTTEHDASEVPSSENNSMYDLTRGSTDQGVVLDANREVRVKLYMGQVFMGWIWFIPTFHMPHTPSTSSTSSSSPSSSLPLPQTTKFHLTQKDVDFHIGVGADIIDVEISLEWLSGVEAQVVHPPPQVDPSEEPDAEPQGAMNTAQALAAGNVGDAVHTKQAAED